MNEIYDLVCVEIRSLLTQHNKLITPPSYEKEADKEKRLTAAGLVTRRIELLREMRTKMEELL